MSAPNDTQRELRSFREMHYLSWKIATRLFDADAAAREVDEVTREAMATFRHPDDARAAEAWILRELLHRAERAQRAAGASRPKGSGPTLASSPLVPLWEVMHARGELAALLRGLPRVVAQAFLLRFIDKRSLREIMYRTRTPAGVVERRIAEAVRHLEERTKDAPQPLRASSECDFP